MTKVDIDKLSEDELIDLNHRIVERLRFLNQMRAHSQMLDFGIGERVTFQPEGRPELAGIVTRYNRKTLTVITDAGERWNVSPRVLRKAPMQEREEAGNAKVVPIRKG
ncbi:MAG: hypothetical protein OEN50_07760 [Deltaproteobacteria bacterium]|nr:hypothetical protein [Deltaproteobacteria bacterium]